MPLKCRSCGHLNRKNSDKCERCGCDLRYSSLFEEMIQIRESESRYLFPLPETGDPEEQPIVPESVEDNDFSAADPVPGATRQPGTRPAKVSPGPSATLSQMDESFTSHVFQVVTIELCLFMVLFFLLSVLTQATAPGIQIPNWKLAVVALFFHVFLEGSLLWFGNRMLGTLLSGRQRRG